jgi:hypothetical protein
LLQGHYLHICYLLKPSTVLEDNKLAVTEGRGDLTCFPD